MGTNYYYRIDPCKECGHSKEIYHIGKSSWGWSFSFQAIEKANSWKEWQMFLQTVGKIFNEYDEEISYEKFKKIVEDRAHPSGKLLNHAERHPENCFRDDEGYSFSNYEFS